MVGWGSGAFRRTGITARWVPKPTTTEPTRVPASAPARTVRPWTIWRCALTPGQLSIVTVDAAVAATVCPATRTFGHLIPGVDERNGADGDANLVGQFQRQIPGRRPGRQDRSAR